MGQLNSRHRSRNETDLDMANGAYGYPAKSGGAYFGSHFLMGGERFEIVQPESYLFGESSDLNFLGAKPVQFPYPIPPSTKPYKPLYCSVVVRRDSLKFVRLPNNNNSDHASTSGDESDDVIRYHIEFQFDCDCPCTITIYYYASEQLDNENLVYVSKRPELTSKTYRYGIGAGQLFRPLDLVFNASLHEMDQLRYDSASDCIPIVVHAVAEPLDPQASNVPMQSHALLASVDRSAEGQGYVLKVVKQKQLVDGVCYLMQEIYGIENKHGAAPVTMDHKETGTDEPLHSLVGMDDSGENSGECIVCMSELRDTVILPCRHLCLCSACAETLRYKASNCPICRSPFRALFQIKTLRKKAFTQNPLGRDAIPSQRYVFLNDWTPSDCYEFEPILYALNGPTPNASNLTVNLPRLPSRSMVGASSSSRRHRPAAPASQPALHAATSILTTPSSQQRAAVPPVAGHHRTPRAPPRRGHRRKKHAKIPPPIQEVLTPQSLVAKPVEKIEMTVRNGNFESRDASLRAIKKTQVAPSDAEDSEKNSDQKLMPEEYETVIQCATISHYDTPTSSKRVPVVDQSFHYYSQDEFEDNCSVDFSTGPTVTINFEDEAEEELKSISSQEEYDHGAQLADQNLQYDDDNAEKLSTVVPAHHAINLITVGYSKIGFFERMKHGDGLHSKNDEKTLENDQNEFNQSEVDSQPHDQKLQYTILDETALSSVSSTSNSSNKPLLSVGGAGVENAV